MKKIDRMRRNVRSHYADAQNEHSESNLNSMSNFRDEMIPMEMTNEKAKPFRFENTIEAKVEEGDTLQALALRFHCSVSEIKRLNNFDKDNEIYARKIVKIPVTVENVLLGALPAVHSTNNNSPHKTNLEIDNNSSEEVITVKNPLEEAEALLMEKKLVDAVNSSRSDFNRRNEEIYTDADSTVSPHATYNAIMDNCDSEVPLLGDLDTTAPDLRPIPGPSLRAITWSGTDCDMSWICLLILILALCFVIPLVYVIYLAEHPHSHHHNTTHF